MNVKLIVLKSGEDIVADVQEMVVKDMVVGYYFKFPCRVNLYGSQSDQEGNTPTPFKMQLTPWMPLSKDEVIPVPTDWVVSIVNPLDKLKDMYLKGVENYETRKLEASDSDEQSDASDSD